MKCLWLAVLLLGACGDDGGHGTKPIDAAAQSDTPNEIDAPAPVQIAVAKAHTLYLNTDGVTLHPGSDDATADRTPLVAGDVVLTPWLGDQADRATQIAAVVAEISAKVAPYDITVVTTRPQNRAYHEIVVTDDPASKVNSAYTTVWALTSTACNSVPSAVGLIFPGTFSTVASERAIYVENFAVGYFAFLNGIPATTRSGDCMCLLQDNCTTQVTSCSIGGPNTPVDTSQNGAATCGWSSATIWEAGAFTTAFGAHS